MRWKILFAFVVTVCGYTSLAPAADARDLRLVPFPKDVTLCEGSFALNRPLVIQGAQAEIAAELIGAELQRAGLARPKVAVARTDGFVLRLGAGAGDLRRPGRFREGATAEDYELQIEPGQAAISAPGAAGLLHGVQTLCQLIRANRTADGIPCLSIRDWPSLRWRCFQDDLTRGPSSTLATLKREIEIGASLKLNLFTYYMEYQYDFAKHPLIGPKDGSLRPGELKLLVAHAKPLGVDILGNQQSFGHFGWILRHEKYAALRENRDVLTPTSEKTYELLDDLYSEVCPILPFEMFNVCCDETWGLGEGPSKDLAKQIGAGGVYVRHIRQVHDLLKEKYHKRMMMWGDIILQHPDQLERIPKDTVMLTWGYDARDSFENQIVPFAKSGYEFFVCPGVSNWSRILPDFGVANVNIRNFVRDGVKHGAAGMLNTSWEDDGESLKGVIWYGHAWAAECAWNASATDPADFNRRIGAVLFGEQGGRFGKAIELLAQTHRLAGMQGMNNRRFWQDDFLPRGRASAIEVSAGALLKRVRPAIEDLEACRREATINRGILDCYLLGARRMELIAQRMLDGLAVAKMYSEACDAKGREAVELIDKARQLVLRNRDVHQAIGKEFSRLWLVDCRPYALDWTTRRYADAAGRYERLAEKLAAAGKLAEKGQPLPSPQSLGFALTPGSSRN